MTRKEMEAVIKGGGSVLHGGKVITSIADLPQQEDLAQTDTEKADVAQELRGQIDALSERLAKVEGGPSDAELIANANAEIERLETSLENKQNEVAGHLGTIADLRGAAKSSGDLQKQITDANAKAELLRKDLDARTKERDTALAEVEKLKKATATPPAQP